jgi:opacity protein-like surface antigen
MKKTCLPLALFALIGSVAVPTAVSANDFVNSWLNSLYVSTFLGGHFLPDVTTVTSYDPPADIADETYELDTGFAARLALGGHVSNHIRSEVEVGFLSAGQNAVIEAIRGGATTANAGDGDIAILTLLGNVWLDLPVFDDAWRLTPYVGGGVGAALVQPDLNYSAAPAYGPQDSSIELAAQLGAGLNWAISDRFSAGLGYRLLFVNGPKISQTTGASEVTTYRFEDILSHSVGVTLTMHLN